MPVIAGMRMSVGGLTGLAGAACDIEAARALTPMKIASELNDAQSV